MRNNHCQLYSCLYKYLFGPLHQSIHSLQSILSNHQFLFIHPSHHRLISHFNSATQPFLLFNGSIRPHFHQAIHPST